MSSSIGGITGRPGASFIRAVGILASGAAAGHALTALAMPVLSRLYTPADFSSLAVFTSLSSILSVAAGLRFDIAVPIAADDCEAANLLGLSLLSAAAIAGLLMVPALLMPEVLARLAGHPQLAGVLWVLPIAIFLAVGMSALQGWFIRRGDFSFISHTRIVQSGASSGAQIGVGFATPSSLGLILGSVLNSGSACLALGARLIAQERQSLRGLSWLSLRTIAVKFHRFPKYSTFEALSNTAAIQLPILLIAGLSVGPEAGYLMMAIFALQAPMALIGTAISQAYLSQAPDQYRSGQLSEFTAEILGGLIKTGVGPFVFAGLVGPAAFSLVFGEEWHRAGDLVAWMTPGFIFQFLATPISMSLHVTGNQRAALGLQLLGLIIRVAFVGAAGLVASRWISEAYAISGFVIYLGCLIVICAITRVRLKTVLNYVSEARWNIGLWMAMALAARFLCEVLGQ